MPSADRDSVLEVYRAALETLRRSYPAAAGDCAEHIDLVAFVAERSEYDLGDRDLLLTLDRLSRKIEVVGTLYRSYHRDTMKPDRAAGLAPAPAVEALLCLFLEAFTATGDFRYLNTVLKALDGVLREPAVEVDPRLGTLAEDLVESTPIHD